METPEQDHQIDGAALVPKRNAKHRFRRRIFEAWNHQCAYCGAPATSLDHIKPRHKGGETVAHNLAPACVCNLRKGAQDWQEWFRAQPFWTEAREAALVAWMGICSP